MVNNAVCKTMDTNDVRSTVSQEGKNIHYMCDFLKGELIDSHTLMEGCKLVQEHQEGKLGEREGWTGNFRLVDANSYV